MVYCEQCGAANDMLNVECHRCGHALTHSEEPAPGETSGRFEFAGAKPAAEPASANAVTDLGSGLELPGWLRRAAASTPQIAEPSSLDTAPQLPRGFAVAQPDSRQPRGESAHSAQNNHEAVGPGRHASVEPPRPSIASPIRNHSQSMPEWLKTGQSPVPATPQSDITDTSSFISEGDLPEWIQQIAAADALKQADEERLAAAVAETASIAEPLTPRRITLPGEASARAASNPWLSRREKNGASTSWSGVNEPTRSPASDEEPIEPPIVQQVAVDVDRAKEPRRRRFGSPTLSLPTMTKPKIPMPAFTKPSLSKNTEGERPASDSKQIVRYALIAAIAVLLIVVLLSLVL